MRLFLNRDITTIIAIYNTDRKNWHSLEGVKIQVARLFPSIPLMSPSPRQQRVWPQTQASYRRGFGGRNSGLCWWHGRPH